MIKKVNKKNEKVKNIFLILAILIVIGLIVFLVGGYYKNATQKIKNPVATIEVENYGILKVELYPDKAENTVNNFITLANNGFYNGLTFHRILKDFMVQGGDINKDGTGSPSLSYIDSTIEKDSSKDTKYNIDGEFISNGYEKNDLKLEKGVIAMARGDYSSYASYYSSLLEEGYNSAGSQFFIMTTDDYISLTGTYAGFGKVIDGYDVLEKIANVEVEQISAENTEVSKPVEAPVIKSITIETFGAEYDIPNTHDQFDINSFFSSMMTY